MDVGDAILTKSVYHAWILDRSPVVNKRKVIYFGERSIEGKEVASGAPTTGSFLALLERKRTAICCQ